MGRMWTLVLDTATPYLSLGLFRGEAGVGRVKRVERRHEEVLFGLLEEVLREVGAGREEIGALVLGEGPGSYTGLRIALAAGLGLAQALGARAFGASSLLAARWPYLKGSPSPPSSPPETASSTGPPTPWRGEGPRRWPPRGSSRPPSSPGKAASSWTPLRTPGPSTSSSPSPTRGWSPSTSEPGRPAPAQASPGRPSTLSSGFLRPTGPGKLPRDLLPGPPCWRKPAWGGISPPRPSRRAPGRGSSARAPGRRSPGASPP